MSVVTLTGFMGTGKSTIGRRLADLLKVPFVDTDHEIEQRAGKTVAEIFASEGEPRFREIEREVVADVVQTQAVIATGGGAILDERNYQAMRAAGPVICLRANPESILARTSKDRSRPLLQSDDREQRVRTLLETREPIYAERCDLAIDTTDKTVGQITQQIRRFLKGKPAAGNGK